MDVTAVLAGYTSDASADDLMALGDSIDAHVAKVTEAAETRDFVDVGLARTIGAVLHTLVSESEQYTARERALLAGAVKYFVEHNDENNDLGSPTGLEDDALVLNAVCVYLGRNDLRVAIG
ncbi:MAG TPA: hypothetical protein PLP26_12005 [Ilumatobacteraceae bacterium]|nr:hypothetical protein [Ilumatobacteraceae bacterium]